MVIVWCLSIIALSLVTVVFSIILFAQHTEKSSQNSYEPMHTVWDVAVLDYVALILSVVCSLVAFIEQKSSLPLLPLKVQSYALVLVNIGFMSKLWMFQDWSDGPRAAFVIVATCTGAVRFVLALLALYAREDEIALRRKQDRQPITVSNGTANGDEAEEETVDDRGKTIYVASCIRLLAPYLVPNGAKKKLLVASTWVILIAGKACSVYAPLVLGYIIEDLSRTPVVLPAGNICLFTFLNFAPTLFKEIQDVLYVHAWREAFCEVAELTYRHVHTLSIDWHVKKKMGNVVRTMDRGLTATDTVMYSLLLDLLPALGTGIASFVLVSSTLNQPVVAGICFCAFGVYAWSTYVVTAWRSQIRSDMNEDDNTAHDSATDALVNFETVKCFTNEEHEAMRYLQSVKAFQKSNYHTQASISVLNVSQGLIVQLATLGCMLVTAFALYHQESGFTVGNFVAIQSFVMTIFAPLGFLGYVYSQIISSIVDLQNLAAIIAQQPDIKDDKDAVDYQVLPCDCAEGLYKAAATSENRFVASADTSSLAPRPALLMNDCRVSIEFRNVTFKYPSAPEGSGLKNVSFSVPAGTTTAIVGSTGSGKSSVLRLALRFYDVNGGAVLFNGVDIRRVTQKSVRKLIGVVPQDTCMFNESILYNIRYGNLDASMEEVIEASKLAHLHEFVERLDEKYETVCGERGLKLSGGEKQRLAIARCLIKNPPIVFLDEATSALDNKTEREVQNALQCLEGRTTLVVAHRLTTVQNADQILVLSDGVIVERGTHDALLAIGPGGAYYEMWFAQLKHVPDSAEASPSHK